MGTSGASVQGVLLSVLLSNVFCGTLPVSGESSSSSSSSPRKLGRGQSCPGSENYYYSASPKFNLRGAEEQVKCEESKGLICVQSEDPEFRADDIETTGESGKVCDCDGENGYYFDAVSRECRIQIGLACDPDREMDGDGGWKDKCPEDGFCSRDLGRYGPRGARGMCRCRPGFYVNSFWFVGGGGVICEEEEEKFNKFKMINGPGPEEPGEGRKKKNSPDYFYQDPDMNSLPFN